MGGRFRLHALGNLMGCASLGGICYNHLPSFFHSRLSRLLGPLLPAWGGELASCLCKLGEEKIGSVHGDRRCESSKVLIPLLSKLRCHDHKGRVAK